MALGARTAVDSRGEEQRRHYQQPAGLTQASSMSCKWLGVEWLPSPKRGYLTPRLTIHHPLNALTNYKYICFWVLLEIY